MRIEEVRAIAFGPLQDQTLTLRPGMNVLHGPNEAGKSSWFAALYAGLAGQPKPPVRASDSTEFADRHRPWTGSRWSAGVVVALDDGTRVAFTQDLSSGRSTIHDLGGGKDLTTEDLETRYGIPLTTDSVLDGTRLLGLTRHTARATTFIGQADVLRVLADADQLREAMERVAVRESEDPGTLDRRALRSVDRWSAPTNEAEVDEAWVRYHEAVERNIAARKAHRAALKHHAKQVKAYRAERAAYDRARGTRATVQEWQIPTFFGGVLLAEILVFAYVSNAWGLIIGVLGIIGLLLLRRSGGPAGAPSTSAGEGLTSETDADAPTPPGPPPAEPEYESEDQPAETPVAVGQVPPSTTSTETELRLARDRARANMAPAVEDRIRPWLPRVTRGRYVDATISPDQLTIRVTDRTGAVREADRLSQGTTEQVFLLLRIALTQVLGGGVEESTPLVLDDVTVHSDQSRTHAILELLHELSSDHQVVLFTQEEDILTWAREHLDGDTDQLMALTPASDLHDSPRASL